MEANEQAVPADEGRLERRVGRPVQEGSNADAPICPWCDQQGWDNCQHYDDTRDCMRAWRLQ